MTLHLADLDETGKTLTQMSQLSTSGLLSPQGRKLTTGNRDGLDLQKKSEKGEAEGKKTLRMAAPTVNISITQEFTLGDRVSQEPGQAHPIKGFVSHPQFRTLKPTFTLGHQRGDSGRHWASYVELGSF